MKESGYVFVCDFSEWVGGCERERESEREWERGSSHTPGLVSGSWGRPHPAPAGAHGGRLRLRIPQPPNPHWGPRPWPLSTRGHGLSSSPGPTLAGNATLVGVFGTHTISDASLIINGLRVKISDSPANLIKSTKVLMPHHNNFYNFF